MQMSVDQHVGTYDSTANKVAARVSSYDSFKLLEWKTVPRHKQESEAERRKLSVALGCLSSIKFYDLSTREIATSQQSNCRLFLADEELNYPEPENYLEELQAPAEK